MVDKLINIIQKLAVPKVILRYIMMEFLDLPTINNLLLTIKEMNVLDNYSKDLIIKANKRFVWNCQNGYLTVAQWLYSLSDVNIHVIDEYAFRRSCSNGHLTVAKWLYSLGEEIDQTDSYELASKKQCRVNIHTNEEYAFRWSCANGHLTVAKWLYSLGEGMDRTDPSSSCINGQSNVNIHARYNFAFNYGNEDVLNWLNTLPQKN